MVHFDVAVIGAGSFGSWIAYTLAERGLSVALADAHGSGNARASSGGETRIIRMSYGSSAIYSRMSRESLDQWKRIFTETENENLFVESGALFTASDAIGKAYVDESAAALARLNIPHERLKSGELKKRYPQFRFVAGTTGLFEPTSGVLLARRAVQCVSSAAATRFCVTQLSVAVTPKTVRKEIPAKRYIFACGPWLPTLFPKQLGSLIFPTRQEIVFFGIPPNDARFCAPQMPAWVDFGGGCYTTPDIENRGFKIGVDKHGPPIDPEHDPRVISPAAVKRARAMAARSFPALANSPIVETRVCCYENTWNGDFLIDQLEEDIWIAGGGSGHGFKHGPAVGRYVAALIENRIEAEPRFTLASKRPKQSRGVF
ncbi:MAG TPA: FAD-dependent oxidoreductase [Bryobacteraceae bacterium]|jgi:glycine/D-amino acid oxidase-like deaminating enzyme